MDRASAVVWTVAIALLLVDGAFALTLTWNAAPHPPTWPIQGTFPDHRDRRVPRWLPLRARRVGARCTHSLFLRPDGSRAVGGRDARGRWNRSRFHRRLLAARPMAPHPSALGSCGRRAARRQVTATTSRSARFEVRPMNREERDGVQDEEGESRGDARWRQLNGEHQHDRSESDDGREGNGPRPQLASQDSDSRPERNDGGVPAQERISGTQRIETGPHDPEQHRRDPCRRGHERGMRTTFLRRGHDRERGRDDAREGNHPDRPAQRPELDRTREEDEAAEKEAQADEPTKGPFRSTIHVRASHSRHKDSEAEARVFAESFICEPTLC